MSSWRERRTYAEFLLQREGKMVRVPRERESSHFMMIGDTGAGKSSLIRQILVQVEERGETAIVYDPALEYTPQFYEPGRGDVILNPVDARMPYWSPCDEVRHEAVGIPDVATARWQGQVYGKVVIDLRNGKVWGFPTLAHSEGKMLQPPGMSALIE